MADVWCTQQIMTCGTVCARTGRAESNDCSAVSWSSSLGYRSHFCQVEFSFVCKCRNNTYPDMSAFLGGWPYSMCQETYSQCVANVTTATPTVNASDVDNPAFDRCNTNHLCGKRNATDELLAAVRYSSMEDLKPRPKYTTGQIVGISFGAVFGAIIVLPLLWVCLKASFRACSRAGERRSNRRAANRRCARLESSVQETRESEATLLASPAIAASRSTRSWRSSSSQVSSIPSYESYRLPSYHSTWTQSGPQDRAAR